MAKSSDTNNETKSTGEKQEKAMTKYDLKVQKRQELKAKEDRDRKLGTVAGILIVAALICFVASFPIRTWLTVNGTYITVGGEKVSRVEFDYYYNLTKNSYVSQNGMMLYYMGVDVTGDFSSMMYSDDMTFKDYFEELAVDSIAQNKALKKEAKAAGFTYDTTEEYKEYMDTLRQYATENGVTAKAYIQQLYGVYATESRVKPAVEEVMYANAYYSSVVETLIPTQEEIQQRYDENKDSYDSVDYRVISVDAELPTEPTALADPSAAGTASSGDAAYQPSEAEIAAAMEAAKAKAEALEKTVKTEGDPIVGETRSEMSYYLRDWLFAAERKAGDTTVIEVSSNNRYYVLAFEQRYLDHAKSANIRVIATNEDNEQAILDEWKNGAATEASFAELCDKYNDTEMVAVEGGLMEELTVADVPVEMEEWIFGGQRTSGDTTVITPEGDGYAYVVYYVSPGREEWVINIENTIQSERASQYLEEMAAKAEVVDKKGNLNYLKIYEARKEAEAQNGENTPEPAPAQ